MRVQGTLTCVQPGCTLPVAILQCLGFSELWILYGDPEDNDSPEI